MLFIRYNVGPVLTLLCLFEASWSQILEYPVFVNLSDLIPRIVNGQPAALGDIPYQISFKMLLRRTAGANRYYSFCGGAIISRKKLLTAAHCFEAKQSACCTSTITQTGKAVSKYFAVAGSLKNIEVFRGANPKEGGQWRRLEKVVYPSSYKFPKGDIAVVFVKNNFRFNDNVKPVSYERRFRDYKGSCMMSGFGFVDRKNTKMSDQLLYAELPLMTSFWCNKNHNMNMRKHICTSSEISDTAKGDSGGPLVCSFPNQNESKVLVGVLNGKLLYNTKRLAGGTIFSRVSAYSKLIRKSKACSYNIASWAQILEQPVFVNVSDLVPRIINGKPAALGDIPYQISFKRLQKRDKSKNMYSSFCGGAIIGTKKLLTAAHCFKSDESNCFSTYIVQSGKTVEKYFAVAGTLKNEEAYTGDDTSGGAQWRRLKAVTYLGSYKFPKDDIAVVSVKEPFSYTTNVKSIAYARRYMDYRGSCLMSGYGRISESVCD
ncbi:transmembrane protease serine 9-like [Ostrinia furnacalis]|uniref:transmembrane protease serine 9-like n=1 Tax=Ostrinia furnacalis TaxID=93504 RepID=UPI00103A1B1B|nr:transmembrane protease serine 9-like [Ostrinia furnacalis]